MNKSHVRFPCSNTIGEIKHYLLKEYLIERENCVVKIRILNLPLSNVISLRLFFLIAENGSKITFS